ncbi:MAG: MMPL family transporter, partial [Gammaproteobacteria bacterium]|nr:MMPL family transporter [Gammaproteobacteria bacterium]
RLLFGDDKSQDEGQNGIVMLFPSIKLSDGEKVISLADEIRSIVQSGGDRLIIAGEAMILADILNMVFSESPKVFSACGIMIFAILWLFMRSFFLALLCLVPAVFTLSTTLGVMAVFNLELNYINILMIPVLLGISVDSGVHMVNRIIDGDSVHTIISETGTAIFGSILTSGLGIGALLLTEHSGLNSLAQIGTIGLFVNLLVSLLVFPALLSLTQTNIKNEGVMSNRTAQEAS